ncbi:MAG: UvrD-helicase domain-containing protein [Polyangiales bacterium]
MVNAIFIDEAQDTDRIQYEIFATLYKDKILSVLVGDAKQSIYGFRNADVQTYLLAAEDPTFHLSSFRTTGVPPRQWSML